MVVQTAYGKVEGFEEDGIRKWFGVPFAKPPVGELRFRRAQDPESWDGVLACKEFAPSGIQFCAPPDAPKAQDPESEDCLYANVWAPGCAEVQEPDAKQPVFVWIYGGAYHAGSTRNPGYDLSAFARDGIVGVSIPYRLGPLGFYRLCEKSDRFDSNCGFSDVVAGIRWVHDNIAAFGGDPGNITVCGESAGATMTLCALATPALKGCFAKAIVMSGLPTDAVALRGQRITTDLVLEKLGLDVDDPDSVASFASMAIDEMDGPVSEVFLKRNEWYPGLPLTGPSVGDDLLPESVWDALANGNAEGVSCLFGTCHDEGAIFVGSHQAPASWEEVDAMFEANGYGDRCARLRELYGEDEKPALEGIVRDMMFWAGDMRAALAQSGHADVYVYRYDFVPWKMRELGMGALHISDIAPSFDVYREGTSYDGTPREVLEPIHGYMHGSFVRFCSTGDPNGAIPLEWERYEENSRATMAINEECHIEYNSNRALYDFWKDIELYR